MLEPTKTVKAHDKSTNSVTVSAAGLVLAGGDHDAEQRVRLYDADLNELHAMWTGSMHNVLCAAFSDDEKLALTGHGSWGGVKLWDLDKGELVSTLLQEMYCYAVAFQKGKALANFGGGKNVKLPLDQGEQRVADKKGGHDACFGPDPTFWCNVSRAGDRNQPVLRKGSKKLRTLEGHTALVDGLAMSAVYVAVGDRGGKLLLHPIEGGDARELYNASDAPKGLAFSHDGKRLACGLDSGAAIVFDVASGDEVARCQPAQVIAIKGIALSPDGTKLYCGNYDGELKVYSLP